MYIYKDTAYSELLDAMKAADVGTWEFAWLDPADRSVRVYNRHGAKWDSEAGCWREDRSLDELRRIKKVDSVKIAS